MHRPGAESPCESKNSWRKKKKSDIQMLNVHTSQSLLANIREQQDIDYETMYTSIGGKKYESKSHCCAVCFGSRLLSMLVRQFYKLSYAQPIRLMSNKTNKYPEFK